MATEAAWLTGNRLTERRKKKCALTSIGLLMEELGIISGLPVIPAEPRVASLRWPMHQ